MTGSIFTPIPITVRYALLVIVAFASITGCASRGAVNNGPDIPLQFQVPILYVTDRNIDVTSKPKDYFGGGRGDLSYGEAIVAISTRKVGLSEFSNITRWKPVVGAQNNRDELIEVRPMLRTTFDERLDDAGAETTDVVVYIHGYSKKFKTVARNTAHIVFSSNTRSMPILYSWPSRGLATHYVGDLSNLNWSTLHLQNFLRDLVTNEDVGKVHVIAHSLGNQALLTALAQLLDEPEVTANWRFGEIILFAPDYDKEIFARDILPALSGLQSRITLYVSDSDVPLMASRRLNQYPRLGDAKAGIFIAPGIETVDVSSVVTIFDGHSAHRDSPTVQADMHFLFDEGLPASERPTLVPVESADGIYWEIDPTYRHKQLAK